MDYSKLSDFEINKAVLAIKSGIKPLGYAHNADERSAGIVDSSNNYHWFDFCNNAADAWPIILDNRISISAPMAYENTHDWLAYPSSDSDVCVSHANPLRATMIVFLVMQENE